MVKNQTKPTTPRTPSKENAYFASQDVHQTTSQCVSAPKLWCKCKRCCNLSTSVCMPPAGAKRITPKRGLSKEFPTFSAMPLRHSLA
eukprot:3159305-Amphidinium_carterae.1